MKSDSLRNISRWKAWVAFTGFMAFSPIALMAETSVESISAVQQHQVINGVVVDASGEAIIGANVIVEGTSIGTITDFDGHFSLSVPKGKKIKISFIGYKDQVVTRFSSNKELKVVLEDDSQMLGEVEVVAYGSQKKVSVTGGYFFYERRRFVENSSGIIVKCIVWSGYRYFFRTVFR